MIYREARQATPSLSKHLLGWRLAFFGCAAAVLVLALMPIAHVMPGTGWDKADHLLAFAVLGLLGLRAFPGRRAACMGGVLAFGIVIELLQAAVPYRAAEFRDLIADALGVLIAFVMTRLPTVSSPIERPVTTEQRLP